VAPGTYVENIDFIGKAITVISEQGPEVTIIDGGSPSDPDVASVVTFENDERPDSILKGFTVTNGTGNTISGNSTSYTGGGIDIQEDGHPGVTNNIISDNIAVYGGVPCFSAGVGQCDRDIHRLA